MKTMIFAAMSFLSLPLARAGEVQCSIAMADREEALLRVQYEVNGSGVATSKVRLQYVSGKNFIAQVFLRAATSEIDPVNEVLRMGTEADADGNEIHFEANYRGKEVDVYTGVARGTLRGDRPFEKAIVCSENVGSLRSLGENSRARDGSGRSHRRR